MILKVYIVISSVGIFLLDSVCSSIGAPGIGTSSNSSSVASFHSTGSSPAFLYEVTVVVLYLSGSAEFMVFSLFS